MRSLVRVSKRSNRMNVRAWSNVKNFRNRRRVYRMRRIHKRGRRSRVRLNKRRDRSLPGRRNVSSKFLLKDISKGFIVLMRTRAESMSSRPVTKTAFEPIRIAINVLIGRVLWVHLPIFPCNKRFISTGGNT